MPDSGLRNILYDFYQNPLIAGKHCVQLKGKPLWQNNSSAGKMNTGKFSLTAAALILILIPPAGWADILYLKNGKQLKVERAWPDTDQIWFILQGLKASIPRSRILRIERSDERPEKSGAAANQAEADITQIDPRPAENRLPNQLKQTSVSQTHSPLQPKALVLRQDGFDDLTWGIRRSAVQGLEKRSTDSGLDDVVEYTRPADVLKLGDAALISVVYAFWRDHLYTATLWVQGPANYHAMRTAVLNCFGKGAQIAGAGEKYLWSQDLTDALLKYDNDSRCGMLWLRSRQMDRKIKLVELSSSASYLKWMKTRK